MRTLLFLTSFTAALILSISANAATKIAFVTSTTGTGNLSSWEEVKNEVPLPTGLAAGDKICQVRAQTAGLPDANSFRAWLSDSNNDAYCRVLGLTGTIANQCNLPLFLPSAGPWMRVDGEPFADVIEQATAGRIFTPLLVDEQGGQVPADAMVFTQTDDSGTLSGTLGSTTCNDWSLANGDKVLIGQLAATTQNWTGRMLGQCNQLHRLICLQPGAGDALPNKTQWGKRGAFLSNSSGNGKLSTWQYAGINTGIAAGDAVCRAEATSRQFYQPNSYKAYLSDSATNAIDRFTYDSAWIRPDGLLFADGKDSLMADTLHRPLNVTPNGLFSGSLETWTGTDAGMGRDDKNCNNWNDNNIINGLYGLLGRATTTGKRWSSWANTFCGDDYRLYCLSDADVIFHNEFEEPRL